MTTDDFSKAAMMRFLTHLGTKGWANSNTAGGWKAAAGKILEDVGDDEDVRGVDLPMAVRRFNNKHPGQVSGPSLAAYAKRTHRAIEQFVRYVENPAGYQAPGRSLKSNGGDKAKQRSNKGTGSREGPIVATMSSTLPMLEVSGTATVVRAAPGLSLDFPMRPDFLAQVVIPRDMNLAEAKRMARFIVTLAHDAPLEDL